MNIQTRKIEDYERFICDMAWQFYPSFKKKREIKDMIQEGKEIFVRLCHEEKEKPLSCQFITALGIQMKQFWMDELRIEKAKKRGENQILLVSLSENDLTYNPTEKTDKYLDLSSEMKIIVQMLKDTPSELAELSKMFDLKKSILKYLEEFKGWKPRKINKMKEKLDFLLNQC